MDLLILFLIGALAPLYIQPLCAALNKQSFLSKFHTRAISSGGEYMAGHKNNVHRDDNNAKVEPNFKFYRRKYKRAGMRELEEDQAGGWNARPAYRDHNKSTPSSEILLNVITWGSLIKKGWILPAVGTAAAAASFSLPQLSNSFTNNYVCTLLLIKSHPYLAS